MENYEHIELLKSGLPQMRTVGLDETKRLPARTRAIDRGLADHQFELTTPQNHDNAHNVNSE
jgi:hypothetical protein